MTSVQQDNFGLIRMASSSSSSPTSSSSSLPSPPQQQQQQQSQSSLSLASPSVSGGGGSGGDGWTTLPLRIQRLSSNATLPSTNTSSPYSAGLDLSSAEDVLIPAGQRQLIRTDLAIACPPGTYGRIAPRSGLACKYGIDVGAGVIDADYRGDIRVLLFNMGQDDYMIRKGDRIAQLILERIVLPNIIEVFGPDGLDTTERGAGGFGSTGMKPFVPSSLSSDGKNKKQRTISPTSTNDDTSNNNDIN